MADITWTPIKIRLGQIIPWEANPRMSTKAQAARLIKSERELGQIQTLAVSPFEGDRVYLYDGHQRVSAWLTVKEPSFEVTALQASRALSDDERKKVAVLLHTATGSWDWNALSAWSAADLHEWGFDDNTLTAWGTDYSNLKGMLESEQEPAPTPEEEKEIVHVKLAEKFGVPPFSVLDARQGYWQDRKKTWIALGIKGELGRGGTELFEDPKIANIHHYDTIENSKKPHGALKDSENFATPLDRKKAYDKSRRGLLDFSTQVGTFGKEYKDKPRGVTFGTGAPADLAEGYKKQRNFVNGVLMKSDSGNDPAYYFKKQLKEKELGRSLTTEEFQTLYYEGADTYAAGTSIFDPVLCELVYRWFCPINGSILDPFAGEATKGIVAEYLKHPYTGVELRPEQIEANEGQARAIGISPAWLLGDSEKLNEVLPADAKYDLVFTSPPYYDLEIYSESEKDGSAFETYEKFMEWYKVIFRQAVDRMNDNRFLVVKVGEIRDKKTGKYRNFVGDNISCFLDLGLTYYNEMILVTAVGSLALRVGKQFETARKIGKTHQNILIFYKGDPKQIKNHFSPEIEHADAADEMEAGDDRQILPPNEVKKK